MNFRITLIFTLLIVMPVTLSAQGRSDEQIKRHIIKSEYIEQDLYIQVKVPKGYEKSEERYEVLYYLDGDRTHGFIYDLYSPLNWYKEIPNLILVGIDIIVPKGTRLGLIRSLNFTPTKTNAHADRKQQSFPEEWTGGADLFLQSFESEIISLIEAEYRTKPGKRTLMGNSLGGLLCLYSVFEKPGLFENIIASSPPLLFDNNVMLQIESEFAKNNKELPLNIFYAVGGLEGSIEESMLGSFVAFQKQFGSRNYKGLNSAGKIFDGHSHASIKFISYTTGLRYVFAQD